MFHFLSSLNQIVAAPTYDDDGLRRVNRDFVTDVGSSVPAIPSNTRKVFIISSPSTILAP